MGLFVKIQSHRLSNIAVRFVGTPEGCAFTGIAKRQIGRRVTTWKSGETVVIGTAGTIFPSYLRL